MYLYAGSPQSPTLWFSFYLGQKKKKQILFCGGLEKRRKVFTSFSFKIFKVFLAELIYMYNCVHTYINVSSSAFFIRIPRKKKIIFK